jgi:hypothetical protein
MANPFNKPFREEGLVRNKLGSILIFGLFIFLFLFFFKPFGLSQIEPLKQLMVTFGFGIVTTFVLIIFKFLLDPLVSHARSTLGKSIVWDLIIATSIGIANYFYLSVVFDMVFSFKYLVFSIWTAILVGSIPVTINYIISFNRRYKTALEEAAIVPKGVLWENDVIIRAGNPRNEFRCNLSNVVYLCSNDNYVTIVTIKEEALAKTHLRGTLKAAEEELKRDSRFFRCHKCYVVNSEYVDHLTGNVQNMKIRLTQTGIEIPVSRSRSAQAVKKFRAR